MNSLPSRRHRLLALVLSAPLAACAHTAARSAAMSAVVAEWPVVPVQAWISGHRLSVMLPGEHGLQRFRAWWRPGGLDEHGFRFRITELRPVDLTPEPDERPGRARTVDVLDVETWERFTQDFAERLCPPRQGEATLLELGGRNLALFRDEGGRVRHDLLREVPGDVAVTRRLNLTEIAIEAARFIAAEARRGGATAEAFLFVMPRQGTDVGGFVLFDTRANLCAVVTLPRQRGTPREGSYIIRRARDVSAVTIEAHGIALLKNPVSSVGRLVNIFFQWIATWLTRRGPSTDQPVVPLSGAAPMSLRAWEDDLTRLTGSRPSRGSIRLLLDGPGYFPVLEQRIREAEESIAIRINIFDTDDVAVRIADLLRERSLEVNVRVLMDRMSTLAAGHFPPLTAMPDGFVMPDSIWRYLERGSRVKARAFLNPWLTADHSKVLIFDRRFAHLGGMNFGREYRYEWHDLMVELEGPIVGRFAKDFTRAWAHASALGDAAYLAAAATTTERFAGETERGDYVDVRPLYTHTGEPEVYGALMRAARRARSYIYVENPYLYDNSFVKALVEARRRGVDVRVILPSTSDLGLGEASNLVTANVLIANGVRVFVYPGMTHVKAAIFDGWACLGSANLNKLSLRRNIETNIATSDPRFVNVLLRELFARDFAASDELLQPVAITGGDRFAEWVMDQF